jgi:hypothetical protein
MSKSKYQPTKDNVLPTAVLNKLTAEMVGSISYGCQIANWMPMGDIVQLYSYHNNPYDVMEAFAKTYFREEREAVRLLGNTSVGRFLFTLKNGERVYEVVEVNGVKAVIEGCYFYKRGDVTWLNVKRKKNVR